MNFDLQINNKMFEIKIVFSNKDGYMFEVYKHIPKKHWWSCSRSYLFKDYGLVGENVKETIINSIKEYLTQEETYKDFIKQVAELNK